ncbi:MAG: hypothetical protein JRH19_08250 [Deltaproteobacteria bacterium]|nr:hypothetical protein [Deltaproteobacteria bacterium]
MDEPRPAVHGAKSAQRLLVGFFVRFMLLYAVLIMPWPAFVEGYGDAYRYAMNGVARDLPLDHKIWLRPNPKAGAINDSQLMRGEGGSKAYAHPHSSRYPAYSTTAFLIALILATPTAWPHRLASLLWGLLILVQLLGLRMVITFLVLDVDGPLPWQSAPPAKPTVFASPAGRASGSLWYVIATAIWALLMLRRLYTETIAARVKGG